MSNPAPNDDGGAVQAIRLEYDRPSAAGWEPMVRLMASGVVAQGAGVALIFAGQMAQAFANGARFRFDNGADLFGLAVELGRGAVGVGLIAAGWMMIRRRALGPRLVGPLELAVAALAAARAVATIWQYQRFRFPPAEMFTLDLVPVLYLLAELVLPALLWVFSRRPEVRATLAGN